MIRIITGDFGSGKTHTVSERIQNDVANGRKAILLVPEQATVGAESAMAALLPPNAPLYFEVCNFSRLANTVFRKQGGLSYYYADRATRTLCMWRALRAALPSLNEKENALDLGRVRRMTDAMRELSSLSLTPELLGKIAGEMEEDSSIKAKIDDLCAIATKYRTILSEKYGDAETDLDRLYNILLEFAALDEGDPKKEKDPLKDTHIYVDGFTSFTEQQWKVLVVLARTHDLTVTLTLPAARAGNPVFFETQKTYARLCALQGIKVVSETDLGDPKRPAEYALLNEALFALFDIKTAQVCNEKKEEKKENKESQPPDYAALASARTPLRILRAEDSMAECEWIVTDILRRVKEEGAHYRDFAIIARHAEQYAGILDTVFSEAGVPLFMSRHTDISSYAAIKLIYAAYAVCASGWRMGDVISYCKCGLSGMSQEDIDAFVLYVSRWNLSGARFTSDEEWKMNPDGYTAEWTVQGKNTLARVEQVRQNLRKQLAPLAESCHRQKVRAHAEALYNFLLSIELEKTLAARQQKARSEKNTAEADELSRLFAVICDALDRLVDCMGDEETEAEEFVDLLRLLFGEITLSRIPSSLDEVTVGSADLARIGDAKHVYLIGVNDGEFPAQNTVNSIFTDSDRKTIGEKLEKLASDIKVEIDPFAQAARELFCFARAFAAASESVCLLCAEKTLGGTSLKPAAPLTQLAVYFSLPIIPLSALPPMERLWSRSLAWDRVGLLAGTQVGEALQNALGITDKSTSSLTNAEVQIGAETANELFGGNLYLSQSIIEKYRSCPFAYFCEEVLHLDSCEEITFNAASVGNLLHSVLEDLFNYLKEQKKKITDLTEAELKEKAKELIEKQIQSVCPNESLHDAKTAHLVQNLEHAFMPVIERLHEEFTHSKYLPTFYEEKIEDRAYCQLDNGTNISVSGRVDRIDTWKNGEKIYFRVIDYKTGDRTFKRDDIEKGFNVQLLLYLFMLWKQNPERFTQKLGEGEILPAGVLYTAARSWDKSFDAPVDQDTMKNFAKTTVYRRGLLLEDMASLHAMDPGLTGRFIPVTPNEKGDLTPTTRKKYLATMDELNEMEHTLKGAIAAVAQDMQTGQVHASPQAVSGTQLPCEFCEHAPVCRATRKKPKK